MSQFHWHVTDSQSFPLVIPGFTELASAGAYDPSMVYSPSEVQDIVDYAGAVSIHFTFFLYRIIAYAVSLVMQRGIDVMVVRRKCFCPPYLWLNSRMTGN